MKTYEMFKSLLMFRIHRAERLLLVSNNRLEPANGVNDYPGHGCKVFTCKGLNLSPNRSVEGGCRMRSVGVGGSLSSLSK